MDENEMSDLERMRYFFVIQVKQKKCEMFIFQEKYLDDLLKMFNLYNCKPMSTSMGVNKKLKRNNDDELINGPIYRSLVGSNLIYLTNT